MRARGRHRRAVLGATAAVLALAAATPAAAGEAAPAATVQWEHHWIQDQGTAGGENSLEEHTPNPQGHNDLCGGYVSGYAGPGHGNWIIHHSHISPTFTVAPGGHIEIRSWQSFGADFGATTATMYVELERDYTTGQHWPNEADRPKYYTRSANRTEVLAPVSIDISALAGHHVKMQFRCVQGGHPPIGATNHGIGSGFTLGNFSVPAV
jgi:hypothetical protein